MLLVAVKWFFCEVPRGILKAWRNFLVFNLNYFSVLTLLKTLFSPWRRYHESYGRIFEIGKNFQVFAFNLMSRTIGFLLRVFCILSALILEILIVFAGIIILLFWIFLPAILVFNFLVGIRLLI